MKLKNSIITLLARFLIVIILTCSFNIKVYANDNLLKEVKDTLIKYYMGEIPESVLNATSIEEVYEFLGDPYTQYFTKGEFQDFLNSVDMNFIGIGVNIEMVLEGARVTSVMVDSPAMETGIRKGDIIACARDHVMPGLMYNEALKYINGIESEFNTLEIIKNGKLVEVSIMPRKLSYPTVVGELIDNHIGYIRIMSFGSITSEEFNKKLYELKSYNADSFIIDLRNNPGGYLYSAINIAGYFIGQNTAIIIEDKVNGRFSIKAEKQVDVINEPVIFLTNEFSASASEILLGAVRFYRKDFFIGENTYGKGVAQSVFKFNDGSVLKTTTLKFYTPNGREINNIGIAPNIKINNVDPLVAAELLLKENKKSVTGNGYAKLNIDNREYIINLEDIHSKDKWEAYRHILGAAKSLLMIDNFDSYKKIPKIQLAEIPITSYKAGDRISFKLNAPNYSKKIKYRAILWNEATNTYKDVWATGDCYYSNWIPNGNEIFTVGFTGIKPGNYRIKFYAKRLEIGNKYTALKGMNCDSYIGEVPFIVSPS